MEKFKTILISLSIVIGSSATLAVLGVAFKLPFWPVCCSLMAIQIVLYQFWVYIVDRYYDNANSQIQANISAVEALQTVNITCAFCKKNNKVPILLNIKNEFKCIHCNNDNAVKISMSVARKTSNDINNKNMMDLFNDMIPEPIMVNNPSEGSDIEFEASKD